MNWGEILKGLGHGVFKIGAIIFMAIVLGVYIVIAIGATITGAALQKH
jgi:hypothetical protein